jgi:hypothetical protein
MTAIDSAAGKKMFSLGHTHTPNTQNFFSTYQLFPCSTKDGAGVFMIADFYVIM